MAKPKQKGMRGEYEVAAIMQEVKDEVAESLGVPELSTRIVRNLEQTRGGGYDLVGTFDFAMEVKFQEQFSFKDWWAQAVGQTPEGMIPVLIYRKANVKFRVRMHTYFFVGTKRVRVLSDMDLPSFLTIFRLHCIEQFEKLKCQTQGMSK